MDEDPVGPSSRVESIGESSDFAGRNVLERQIAVNGGFLFPGSAIAV